MTPERKQEIREWIEKVDAVQDFERPNSRQWWYLTESGFADAIRWHISAAEGSFDWFSNGIKALAKTGQRSEVYERNAAKAQAFLIEARGILAELESIADEA